MIDVNYDHVAHMTNHKYVFSAEIKLGPKISSAFKRTRERAYIVLPTLFLTFLLIIWFQGLTSFIFTGTPGFILGLFFSVITFIVGLKVVVNELRIDTFSS